MIHTRLLSTLLLVSLAHGLQEETTKPCNDMALESIPAKYATTMMMNIQFGNSVGRTQE